MGRLSVFLSNETEWGKSGWDSTILDLITKRFGFRQHTPEWKLGRWCVCLLWHQPGPRGCGDPAGQTAASSSSCRLSPPAPAEPCFPPSTRTVERFAPLDPRPLWWLCTAGARSSAPRLKPPGQTRATKCHVMPRCTETVQLPQVWNVSGSEAHRVLIAASVMLFNKVKLCQSGPVLVAGPARGLNGPSNAEHN